MSIHEAELTSEIDNKQEQLRLPNLPKAQGTLQKNEQICLFCERMLYFTNNYRNSNENKNAIYLPSKIRKTKIRKQEMEALYPSVGSIKW